MENSSRFFQNTACEYYPCHQGIEELNCLFCYCPLYRMKNCPGHYEMIESGGRTIKSCTDCTFPHIPANYDKIMAILTTGDGVRGSV